MPPLLPAWLRGHLKRLAALHASLIAACVLANSLIQVFCRPTPWAAVAFGLCAVACNAAPVWEPSPRWRPLVQFGYGLCFSIWLYCAVFLEGWPLFALPLVFFYGLGPLLLVPYYFLFYLSVKRVAGAPDGTSRWAFAGGIGLALVVAGFGVSRYKTAEQQLTLAARTNYVDFEPTWMTEKVVGLGLVYHTEITGYDGWRPPLHEPLVNLGYWWGGRVLPGPVDVVERLNLYRRLFPESEPKKACACAVQESGHYHEEWVWLWR